MNPLGAIAWFWRAWRARSVTFAALFALSVLGFSVLRTLRHAMQEMGAPWYVWLPVPFVVVAVLARKEADWMPDAALRRKWALRIVVGAIIGSLLLAKFRPPGAPDVSAPLPTAPKNSGRANPHAL